MNFKILNSNNYNNKINFLWKIMKKNQQNQLKIKIIIFLIMMIKMKQQKNKRKKRKVRANKIIGKTVTLITCMKPHLVQIFHKIKKTMQNKIKKINN